MNISPTMRWSIKKVISIAVVFSFTFNQILFAHLPAISIWAERQQPSPTRTSKFSFPKTTLGQSHRKGGLPTRFGLVRDSYSVGSQSPVLIIQDVHLNVEAQGNVARMLSQLRDENRLGLVGVEGAFAPFDFQPFFDAGDQNVRIRVADSFLERSRIGAPSYVGVTSPKLPTNYVGIDDASLYQANIDSYLTALKNQPALKKSLAKNKHKISELKRRNFNSNLLAFDRLAESYQEGTLPLGQLLETSGASTPSTRQFLEAYRIEKTLDFARVEAEKKNIIKSLVPLLSAEETRQLSQSDTILQTLVKLMNRHGLTLDETSAFKTYVRYSTLSKSVNGDDLIKDTNTLIAKRLNSLAKTPQEKLLLEKSRTLYLTGKLLDFALTPDEWERYKTSVHSPLTIDHRLKFSPFENFYRYADLRSEKIVQNFLTRNQELGTRNSISTLIIGGFHTPLVTAELKRRGVSYVVMSPNITKFDGKNGSEYLSAFSQKKTPLEKLFAGEKLFINPSGTVLGAPSARATNGAFEATQKAINNFSAQGSRIISTQDGHYAVGGVPFGYLGAGEAVVANEGLTLQPVVSFWQTIKGFGAALKNYVFRNRIVVGSILTVVVMGVSIINRGGFSPTDILFSVFLTTLMGAMATQGSGVVEKLIGKTIVEVTMEMALSKEMIDVLTMNGATSDDLRLLAMSNSTGGIGPLLKERVIAQSNMGANVVAFTPLYESVWVQKVVPVEGLQRTRIVQEKVDIGHFLRAVIPVYKTIPIRLPNGTDISVDIRKSPEGLYGKAHVFYVDYPEIMTVVYPGEKDNPGLSGDVRMLQSWILGRASLQMLKNLAEEGVVGTPESKNAPEVAVVMSEMPSIFADHRLFQDEFTNDAFFQRFRYVFNDHTPLDYAHPLWDMANISRMHMATKWVQNMPVWFGWLVDGTAAAINAADAVFGVAIKHGEVMRQMPPLRQFADKIKTVTNGVSPTYWPHKNLLGWRNMSDQELLAHKEMKRRELIGWLASRQKLGDDWAQKMIDGNHPVGVWTRRVVHYKRADLLSKIANDPRMAQEFLDSGIVMVWGGRIHQDDDFGPYVYDELQKAFERNPLLKERIIFLDNYNIFDAPELMRGANFSVMLANDKREASATGFHKVQMNGGLVIANIDGAVGESVYEYVPGRNVGDANGFIVPYEFFPHDKEPYQPTARGFLDAMKKMSNVFSDKVTYAAMVRNALKVGPFISVDRTAVDQLTLISNMFDQKDADHSLETKGREIAVKEIERLSFSQEDISSLSQWSKVGDPFVWRYLAHGHQDTVLFKDGPGFEGFIRGYQHISQLGTVGEWSVAYHSYNKESQKSDIANHLLYLLSQNSNLNGLAPRVNELVDEIHKTTDPAERRRATLVLMGFAQQLFETIKEKSLETTVPEALVPGAMGVWASSKLSFAKIGMWETLLVSLQVGLALLGVKWMVGDMSIWGQSVFVLGALVLGLLLNMVGHYAEGVYTGQGNVPVSSDARLVRLAAYKATAYEWPAFFALGLAVGVLNLWTGMGVAVFGVSLAAFLHYKGNAEYDRFLRHLSSNEKASDQLVKSELELAHELGRRIFEGEGGDFSVDVEKLTFVRDEELRHYTPEEQAALIFTKSEPTFDLPKLFFRHALVRQLRKLFTADLGTLLHPKNHILLIPNSKDQRGIELEVLAALKILAENPENELRVYLDHSNSSHFVELQNSHNWGARHSRVQFVAEHQLQRVDQIDELLLQPLENEGKLQIWVNSTANMPIELIRNLLTLESERYKGKIEMILVNELLSQVQAARVQTMQDVQALLKFLEVIKTHA